MRTGCTRPTSTRLSVRRRRLLGLVALIVVLPALTGWGLVHLQAGTPLPPTSEVGFSFSPAAALADGEDPGQALTTLLNTLHPDLIRLPLYWDAVAPEAGEFDFTSADALIGVVDDYDRARGGGTVQLVLVVGARNMGYPELHVPGWASAGGAPLASMLLSEPYRAYLATAVARYASRPNLAAWQLENEPLDHVGAAGGDDAVPAANLESEVGLLHEVDPHHQVVVTSFNSASAVLDQEQTSPLAGLFAALPGPHATGHMAEAIQSGDVAGLDAYVVTPKTPLGDAGVIQRIGWKQQSLGFWARRAEAAQKGFWMTEMQATNWPGQSGFTPDDLVASAQAYTDAGPAAVLLWGVEDWLGQPEWMAGGERAMSILRHGQPAA